MFAFCRMIERSDDSSNKAKNMIEMIFRQAINQDKTGKMRFISYVILKGKKLRCPSLISCFWLTLMLILFHLVVQRIRSVLLWDSCKPTVLK